MAVEGARDRVGIYLRLICSVGLRLKHCNVRVPYQQGEGAMQWVKLLHLVRRGKRPFILYLHHGHALTAAGCHT